MFRKAMATVFFALLSVSGRAQAVEVPVVGNVAAKCVIVMDTAGVYGNPTPNEYPPSKYTMTSPGNIVHRLFAQSPAPVAPGALPTTHMHTSKSWAPRLEHHCNDLSCYALVENLWHFPPSSTC